MTSQEGGAMRRPEAMEASVDGMAILNPDDEYVYVNQAHADIYGYESAEDFVGNTWRMLYDEDEEERIENEVFPELDEKGEWRGEATGVRADGSEFPQELSLSRLDDGGLVCVVRDITERKEREKELERYEMFVETSPDVIVHLGDDGTVLYTSPPVERVLGYGQEEMVGENAFDYVHPEDREKMMEAFASAVEGEDTGEDNTPFRVEHADGSYIWVENAGADASSEPHQTAEGVVLSLRDITERKEREKDLERHKAFVENSSDSITHLDEEGYILYRSPSSERVEDEPGDMTGTHGFDHIHPDDRERVSEKFFSLLSDPNKSTDTVEYRSRRADGSYEWVEAVATDQRDTEVGGVVVNTRVIDERKEREEELRRIKERLDLAIEGAELAIWDRDVKTGEVVYNDQWLDILGMSPEDAESDVEFWEERVHPDDVAALTRSLKEHFKGETERYDVEYRIRTADNDWRWMRSVGQVVERDDDGNAERAVGVHMDIDERKEREKELERYEAFIKNSLDVFSVLDEAGKHIYNSPSVERILGYDPDEHTGEYSLDYVHPEDMSNAIEWFYSLVEGDKKISQTELRYRSADGSYVWFEIIGKDKSDTEVGGVIFNGREITGRKERERELREQQRLLDTVMSNVPAVAFEIDDEGIFTRTQGKALEKVGLQPEELVGESVFDVYEGRPEVQDGIERALSGEKVRTTVEYEGRVFEAWYKPVTDEDGSVTGVVGLGYDITEREERERELREQQRVLDTVMSNMPVVVFSLDEEGVFTRSQGKGLESIGLEPGEAVGESVFEMYEDEPEIIGAAERALAGERTQNVVEYEGTVFETWYEPLTDDDGSVTGVVGLSYDITERKEREKELERYEAFVEHSSDVVTLVEEDGTLLYYSPSVEIHAGHDQEERIGDNIYDYIHPDDRERVMETYTKLVSEPDTGMVEEEFRYQKGDGSYIWVESHGTDQRDTDLDGIVVNSRDITERKEREKELERYEAVVENTSDMIMVLDESGTIVYQSPSVEHVMGYGQDERIGENSFDYLHPDDRQKAMDAFQEVIEDPETDSAVVEVRAQRADGTYVWLEIRGADQRDTEVGGFVTTSRDITGRKEREKELERYEAFVENSSDVITHIDEDGTVLYQSPASERILGRDGDEREGESALKNIHPDDRDELAEKLETLMNDPDEKRLEAEFRVETEDGSYVWFETIATDRTDTEFGGVVANSRDVTERKQNKRRLERSRDLLRHTERIADTGGWEFDVEKDEIRWTEGAENMHVLPTDDDMPPEEVYELYHPDDREELRRAIERCIKEGEPYEIELRLDTKDDTNHWLRTNGEAVREDGRTVKVRGALQDITERKEREEDLRRNRELLKHTERIADTGGWEIDTETNELRWTEGTRDVHELPDDYEPTVEEAVDFYHPEDKERIWHAVERCLEGEPFDEELRLVTAEDNLRWVRSLGEPVRDDDEVVELRGAIQDITERKERERRLRERKEQIDFFNSLLRHDMLNSMTVISGNAEILKEELSDDERELAEKISKHSKEIVELTERVRSVLRRLTEEGTTEISPMDISEIVKDRCESLEETYPEVTCRAETPDDLRVIADSFLHHVLDNVLVNAVEHNDKDEPHVEVTVEEDEDEETVTVRVADNGPGIPDENKNTVFDQGTTGRSSGGVGFGLYYVDAMVSEYGGDVRIEDNDPEGAVVVIGLPKAKSEDVEERGENEETAGETERERGR